MSSFLDVRGSLLLVSAQKCIGCCIFLFSPYSSLRPGHRLTSSSRMSCISHWPLVVLVTVTLGCGNSSPSLLIIQPKLHSRVKKDRFGHNSSVAVTVCDGDQLSVHLPTLLFSSSKMELLYTH